MRIPYPTISSRTIRALVVLGSFALSASSCMFRRTGPEPTVSSVAVRNRGFFDVNVYSLPSPAAMPIRLGTVVGGSTATFPLHPHDLQPGNFLAVRIRAIGARSSWTSPTVSVGDGVLAVLDVDTDASGDCSRSNLHTIITSDSIMTPPAVRR